MFCVYFQVTEETSDVLQRLGYSCECRGFINVKGKGELKTFFVCTDMSKQQGMGLSWGKGARASRTGDRLVVHKSTSLQTPDNRPDCNTAMFLWCPWLIIWTLRKELVPALWWMSHWINTLHSGLVGQIMLKWWSVGTIANLFLFTNTFASSGQSLLYLSCL